jgi:Protein of unknown function (DUF3667)
MTDCLNCDNSFEGSFCNLCGQKASTHRFTMHEWLHEIPHSILHVDSGFFLTIKTLFVRPGDAIREYLQGKRKLLFSPFLYLLVMCGVFVVVSHYISAHSGEQTNDFNFTNLQEASDYLEKYYYKIIIIILVLPITIASYLAYLKSGFNFAENLVLNAYLTAQLVITDLIMLLIASTGFKHEHINAFIFIDLLLKLPYWFWTYRQFFRPSKWYWGVLQFILFQIIYTLILSGLISAAAFVMLKLKGSH